jgi:hypothetical protein
MERMADSPSNTTCMFGNMEIPSFRQSVRRGASTSHPTNATVPPTTTQRPATAATPYSPARVPRPSHTIMLPP